MKSLKTETGELINEIDSIFVYQSNRKVHKLP